MTRIIDDPPSPYVDASALVKLIVPEAESREMLRWYVEVDRVITEPHR